jgi:hypothetical protein
MSKQSKIKCALLVLLPLVLTGCPPFRVSILTPSNGEQFDPGEEILFTGSARALMEGELTGNSLIWTSSIDNQIGTGTSFTRSDLSEGMHTITLTAINARGEEGITTIDIIVGEETPPTTSTTSNICPPDSPIECPNGCCFTDYPICCDNGCCPTDYTICGEGEDEGKCFPDEANTTTTTPATTTTVVDPGALVLSSAPATDILFYSIHEDGSSFYYHGYNTSGGMELTHVISDTGTTAIFNDDFMPIQWITDDLTIAIYRLDDEQPFDSRSAFHVVVDGTNEDSFTLDIYPENLPQIVSELEAYTGQTFDNASNFLDTYNVTSFADLASRAKQDGQDQARFIAASVAFSAVSAFLSMEAEGIASQLLSSISPHQYSYLVQFVVGLMGSHFNDAYGPGGSSDPSSPGVEVLLCRGVSSYIICHYLFFKRPGLEVGPCIDLCLTSMRCFTDICMPKTISADVADGFKDHHSGS